MHWNNVYTNSTTTSEKIIISTTKEAYGAAIQWVNETFLPLYDKIFNKTFPPNYEASTALPMSQTKTCHLKMNNDNYTVSLIGDISDIWDTSYASPPPICNTSWSKPLSILTNHTKDIPDNATTTPSAQASSIMHINQSTISRITALRNMVEALCTKMKQQLSDQEQAIETIVEQTTNFQISSTR